MLFGLADTFVPALVVGVLLTLFAAALLGLFQFVRTRALPEHRQRRLRIAAHWTTGDEEAAWRLAREQGAPRRNRPGHEGRNAKVTRGRSLATYGGVAGGIGLVLLLGISAIMYPHASRYHGSGPRTYYSPSVEDTLDLALWIVSALVGLSVLTTLCGHIVEGLGRLAERRDLQRGLESPAAVRPPDALLQEYSERHSIRLAQVLSVVSGIVLPVAIAVLVLGSVDWESFEHSAALYGGLRLPAAIAAAVCVVLFVVAFVWGGLTGYRGQDLRNALLQRWPTLPEVERDSDGNETPTSSGPALTTSDDASAPTGPA